MANMTITIDDETLDALKKLAEMRGISVEALLEERIAEDLARIKLRLKDPIVGLFDSGESDLSERGEEILRTEWHPD